MIGVPSRFLLSRSSRDLAGIFPFTRSRQWPRKDGGSRNRFPTTA